jgi:hypothetical protein
VFEEETQRVNLEKLKRSSSELLGAELVQTPIEEFKSVMHRELNDKMKSQSGKNQISNKPLVYVMFEPKDKILAENTANILEASGISTMKLDENVENHQLISLHRENLKTTDGVVIVTNNPSGQWTKSKMNDVLKSLGFGRKKSFKAKALVTIEQQEDISITNDYIIVRGNNGNYAEEIKPLIEKLMN